MENTLDADVLSTLFALPPALQREIAQGANLPKCMPIFSFLTPQPPCICDLFHFMNIVEWDAEWLLHWTLSLMSEML
jgi:hypothetical protein